MFWVTLLLFLQKISKASDHPPLCANHLDHHQRDLEHAPDSSHECFRKEQQGIQGHGPDSHLLRGPRVCASEPVVHEHAERQRAEDVRGRAARQATVRTADGGGKSAVPQQPRHSVPRRGRREAVKRAPGTQLYSPRVHDDT